MSAAERPHLPGVEWIDQAIGGDLRRKAAIADRIAGEHHLNAGRAETVRLRIQRGRVPFIEEIGEALLGSGRGGEGQGGHSGRREHREAAAGERGGNLVGHVAPVCLPDAVCGSGGCGSGTTRIGVASAAMAGAGAFGTLKLANAGEALRK